jgi:hypothetical protein
MSAPKTALPRAHGAGVGPLQQIGHFVLHFAEMCAPMCIGFAGGDLLYFWLASLAGYSDPFSELPYLSLVVVTVSMTAPMTAWMRYRGSPAGRSPRCRLRCQSSRSCSSASGGSLPCRRTISHCWSTV